MNELTADDIEVREEGDRGVYIFRQDCELSEIKTLILQNQKIREAVENRLDMAKTLKDDYMIQLCTDILRGH